MFQKRNKIQIRNVCVCVFFFCLFLPRMVPCISDYKSHLVGLRPDHTGILCMIISSFAFYYQDFQLQVRKKTHYPVPYHTNVFKSSSSLVCIQRERCCAMLAHEWVLNQHHQIIDYTINLSTCSLYLRQYTRTVLNASAESCICLWCLNALNVSLLFTKDAIPSKTLSFSLLRSD